MRQIIVAMRKIKSYIEKSHIVSSLDNHSLYNIATTIFLLLNECFFWGAWHQKTKVKAFNNMI